MAVGRGKQEEEIKNRKVGRRNHLIAETILLPKPSYCRNHLIAETILLPKPSYLKHLKLDYLRLSCNFSN